MLFVVAEMLLLTLQTLWKAFLNSYIQQLNNVPQAQRPASHGRNSGWNAIVVMDAS